MSRKQKPDQTAPRLAETIRRFADGEAGFAGQSLDGRDVILSAFLDLVDTLVLPRWIVMQANDQVILRALVAGRRVHNLKTNTASGIEAATTPEMAATVCVRQLRSVVDEVANVTLSVERAQGWVEGETVGCDVGQLSFALEKSRDASGFDELSQHIASAALAWVRRDDTGKVLENGGAAEVVEKLAAVALPSPVNRTSVRAEDDKPFVIFLPLDSGRSFVHVRMGDDHLLAVVPGNAQADILSLLS